MARRAPSASASNLAHTIRGWISGVYVACEEKPQSARAGRAPGCEHLSRFAGPLPVPSARRRAHNGWPCVRFRSAQEADDAAARAPDTARPHPAPVTGHPAAPPAPVTGHPAAPAALPAPADPARPASQPADPADLAALRAAFPGYRIRRRTFHGVPCYLAEARPAASAPAPLAAARSPAVLAGMLAAAAGRPVPLRPSAVAAAYRDRKLTAQQCAAMFGVSRTTIMKVLAAEGVPVRRPGRDLDERAVAAAYRDERLSLHECAVRFGVSERRVAMALDRQGVPRRPVGRPPRRPPASR